ncbi:MAG: hypothetical protein PHS57_03810 [Alphaproteobacteria bacterium]|nr:hypothetical protein [Alphaproteobacteria bacterium]
MSKPFKPTLGIIPLHFDVPEHHIPLSQFIDSAKSAQDIIDNFNRELFDKQLKYELLVVTPEVGGLIELLQVIIPIAAPVWAFLCTDIGKAYIKGLTDYEPSHWAELAGRKTRELSEIDIRKLCTMIIALMVLGFLQKDAADLEKTGFSKEKFHTAYSARNKVYEGCIRNTEVQGLGFDASHDFPIKRADFPRFIVNVPAPIEVQALEEHLSWKVDIVDLIVHSPNWKRDNKKRKWQGSTTEIEDIAFIIEDDNFWHHVRIKDIVPDINDNMRVQWAYPDHATKPTNVRVLRVISYNGTSISEPLTNDGLFAELDDFAVEQKEQSDLFTYGLAGKK